MNLFKVPGNPHSKQIASDNFRSVRSWIQEKYGLHIVWLGSVGLRGAVCVEFCGRRAGTIDSGFNTCTYTNKRKPDQ